MSTFRTPTVLLAAMQSGDHIQIGDVAEHADAYDAFERFDSHLAGWTRDLHGNLRLATGHMHAIAGEPVRFYRLRMEGAIDCRPVRKVRAGYVRKTGFVGLKAGR